MSIWLDWLSRPRCLECRTRDNLHLVEDGIHKGYVCARCAYTTGYVEFIPSLHEEIQRGLHEENTRVDR